MLSQSSMNAGGKTSTSSIGLTMRNTSSNSSTNTTPAGKKLFHHQNHQNHHLRINGVHSNSTGNNNTNSKYCCAIVLLSSMMILYVIVVLVVAMTNWPLVVQELEKGSNPAGIGRITNSMLVDHVVSPQKGVVVEGSTAGKKPIEGMDNNLRSKQTVEGVVNEDNRATDTPIPLTGQAPNDVQETELEEIKKNSDGENYQVEAINKEENEQELQQQQQQNEKGDEERKAMTRSEKRRKAQSIFKEYDLSLNLTHGVKPMVLVQHDDNTNGELPIAMRDDHAVPVHEHPTPQYIVRAYIESTTNITEIPWTIKPLPNRTQAKEALLQPITYTRVRSCTKLLQQFPVDDTPVDQDPFLPWIHDIFPTADGKFIQIIAQNKRRCRSGSFEKDILSKMNPQASLFQHVSVKRVQVPFDDEVTTSTATTNIDTTKKDRTNETRYKLVPHEDADPDGVVTRFICRFKPGLEETLSVFNFLYDWTAYRKRYKASFLEDDAGIKAIHSSQLIFKCPVPDHLQESIRTGSSVQNDYATMFVDIIPIRTPPRWGTPTQYFPPQYRAHQNNASETMDLVFDPMDAWGTNHILPRIDDSGRWENLPICKPSLMTYENLTVDDTLEINNDRRMESEIAEGAVVTEPQHPATNITTIKKVHRLVSCIWASAGYTTRGNRFAINDGQRRLLEWITYNQIIGFDHFYVYDNSGAFGSDASLSLKPIADLFPSTVVTYIPWPAQICNNNPNNVDSAGERSSQYAAEQSCRLRFGPHVDWIGQFDIDEYLVPMGDHKTVTHLLDELDEKGTKIISFASWRAWPRRDFIDEPVPINDPAICWHNEPCFELSIKQNYTMLQSYNCDRAKPGQKTESMPAEKQVYKADYVVSHFVHYSVATVLSEKNRTEYEKEGFSWKGRAFPDPRQRFANEVTEGLMIHTKAVARQDTAGWERMCHINNTYLPIRRQGLCRLGVPWPEDGYVYTNGTANATAEGRAYNCFVNRQVEDYLVPKLTQQLAKHADFFNKPTPSTDQ